MPEGTPQLVIEVYAAPGEEPQIIVRPGAGASTTIAPLAAPPAPSPAPKRRGRGKAPRHGGGNREYRIKPNVSIVNADRILQALLFLSSPVDGLVDCPPRTGRWMETGKRVSQGGLPCGSDNGIRLVGHGSLSNLLPRLVLDAPQGQLRHLPVQFL